MGEGSVVNHEGSLITDLTMTVKNGLAHMRWRRRLNAGQQSYIYNNALYVAAYPFTTAMLGCGQERIPIQHGMARHSGDEDGKHWSTSSRRWIGLDRGPIGGILARLAVPGCGGQLMWWMNIRQ